MCVLQVDVHLHEVMASSSKKLFKLFEVMMAGYANSKNKNIVPNPPMLTTNLDDASLDKANAKKVNFIKRQMGRLKKWMADISLQMCSLGMNRVDFQDCLNTN